MSVTDRPTDVATTVVTAVPAALDRIDVEALRAHVVRLSHIRSPYVDIGVLEKTAAECEEHLRATGLAVRSLPTSKNDFELPTLVARRTGTSRPRDVLVLGAHYDSVAESPGADDNASGGAVALELARVLGSVELPYSVDVGLFPFEEKPGNLAGARLLAAGYADRGERVLGMVSLEMLGFTGPDQEFFPPPGDFLALIGDLPSAALVEHFRAAGERWNPGLRVVAAAVDPDTQPDAKRSDHDAFWDEGLPALMATDTSFLRNPNYHSERDTVDTLDFAFMLSAARTLLAGTLTLAAGSGVVVGPEDVRGAEAASLMGELSAELARTYDFVDAGDAGFDPASLGDRGAFFVARHDGTPVGCVALVPVDADTAEVKRLYVADRARGHGVSKRLMSALEAHAYGQGFGRLRLETGDRQPVAIALYERLGFEHIERWPEYADSERSVCMAKRLSSPYDSSQYPGAKEPE
ncbi:peptidase M28 [Actinobacteria bacterium OK074]|nr:peptidase M28 [Actinobacteria bacterium OK074]